MAQAEKWVRISPSLYVNHDTKRIRYGRELDNADNIVLQAYIARGYDPIKKVVRQSSSAVKNMKYYEKWLDKADFEKFKAMIDESSFIEAAHAYNAIAEANKAKAKEEEK